MPVQVEEMEDYRTKYKTLKRKLKLLIYENECFQEELGKANRALLRVRQDSSFLVEQLLPHYHPPVSSSDSEVTDHSDTETSGGTLASNAAKRRRLADVTVAQSASAGSANTTSSTGSQGRSLASGVSSVAVASKPGKQAPSAAPSSAGTGSSGTSKVGYGARGAAAVSAGKKRGGAAGGGGTRVAGKQGNRTSANRQRRTPQKLQRAANFGNSDGGGSSGVATDTVSGHTDASHTTSAHVEPELSREEVERRLLARQSNSDMSMQATIPLTLPQQIFSDNLMDGDLLMEEIETSPSNLEEDITADNFD